MRQLLNTLFVTSEDIYLSLDGENVVANRGGEAVARYPLHTLQSIVSFSYLGKKYENKIEHFGCKQTYLPEEPMIL